MYVYSKPHANSIAPSQSAHATGITLSEFWTGEMTQQVKAPATRLLIHV